MSALPIQNALAPVVRAGQVRFDLAEYRELDTRPNRKVSPQPGTALRKAIIAALQDEQKTLEELRPYRVRAAWRITRELARITALIHDGQALQDSPLATFENWHRPLALTDHALPYPPYCQLAVDQLSAIERPEDAPSLQPPPDSSLVHPTANQAIQRFILLTQTVAEFLGVHHGSPRNPEHGAYAMTGMDEPLLIQAIYPIPSIILTYETLIVDSARQRLVSYGIDAAHRELSEYHGLSPHEANQVMAMAREQIRSRVAVDPETDRAMMILRLEGYMRRANKSMNLGAEIQALKQMALTLGLYRAEGENPMKDIVASIRSISAERDREEKEMLEANGPPLLEGPADDP